jgi:hypothetical protein
LEKLKKSCDDESFKIVQYEVRSLSCIPDNNTTINQFFHPNSPPENNQNLFINLTNSKMYRCNAQMLNSNDTPYFCQTCHIAFQHVTTTAPPNGDLDESPLHSFVRNFPLLTMFDVVFALVRKNCE